MSSAAEQARRAYQRSTMSLGERVEALERQVDANGPDGVTTVAITPGELDRLRRVERESKALLSDCFAPWSKFEQRLNALADALGSEP